MRRRVPKKYEGWIQQAEDARENIQKRMSSITKRTALIKKELEGHSETEKEYFEQRWAKIKDLDEQFAKLYDMMRAPDATKELKEEYKKASMIDKQIANIEHRLKRDYGISDTVAGIATAIKMSTGFDDIPAIKKAKMVLSCNVIQGPADIVRIAADILRNGENSKYLKPLNNAGMLRRKK